ncbi:MAG: hypothetical protein HC933_15900 [Pleurocapsa sp. SU_196_0]|nr:hypothetical protein [Pleurocapsa sp. SU_196_0]
MKWSPRVRTRASRLLLTLWLLVFSAHHAAPNAPIWTGRDISSGHRHHGVHSQGAAWTQGAASSLAFTAVHEHVHSHCELCFSSAFNLPVRLRVALRPAEKQWLITRFESVVHSAGDVGLPNAHAPPRT